MQTSSVEEWVHTFLNGDGGNPAFSEHLKLLGARFTGPAKLPIHALNRCAGYQGDLEFTESEPEWRRKTADMVAILSEKDCPPIIVQADGLIVRDGNHRLSAALALGWREIPAILYVTERI